MKTQTFSETVAALAAFTLITINAYAVPGALDTTFGTGGMVTTPIGSGHDQSHGVAIQTDGKIVVAGNSLNNGNYDFALARYTTTGALDTTFNGTGKVVTPIGGGNDSSPFVALQADGKIVVAGASSNGSNNDFAVARYTSTGALDTTFNGTGKVTTSIGSGYDSISAVAVQTDGKIVVAGTTYLSDVNSDFALARFTTTGALDTTFNGTGKVMTPIGSGIDSGVAMAVQMDGKIVVAGDSLIGSNFDFALVRYTDTGVLDTTFNGTGKVTADISGGSDYCRSVAVQTDGKIVVAGSSSNGSNSDFTLARYTSTGALDTTFNGTGKLTTDFGSLQDSGSGVAVQADGKVVVTGTTYPGTGFGYAFALVRYTTTGALDTTFNGTGKVVTIIDGDGHLYGKSVALQADGKIVVAGLFDSGSGGFDFALARYSVALPDTRLGTTAAAPVGNNTYNLTGTGQTLSTSIPRSGEVKTDFLRIQNDGPVPDSFKVRGTPSDKNFKVTYFRGATNITEKVVAGTYTTGRLATGASVLLKAKFTAKTAVSDKRRTFGITATSVGDSAAKDKVLIEARSK